MDSSDGQAHFVVPEGDVVQTVVVVMGTVVGGA